MLSARRLDLAHIIRDAYAAFPASILSYKAIFELMNRRIRTGLLMSCLIAPAALPAAAQQSCLKQVFGRFCLGGDFSQQLRQPPAPLFNQKDGDREAAIYAGVRGRRYVMAFRGRIYKVVKEERPSTELHFKDMTAMLTGKYGQPEDHSRYPHYANSRGARMVAIRRGEAKAAMVWRPEPGWHVELSWTRELGVALSYVADELDMQRRQAMEQRL